jgi:hypothetical protein
MRLLCPFCQKAITVPDSEAGKAVNCPECGQQFAAPQLYTPATSTAPPPAPPAAPVEPPESATPTPVHETYVTPPDLGHTHATEPPDLPAMERELSGYGRMLSLPLDAKWIRWLPAAAFFLVFVLTFFPWNGLYPAGYPAYTQNAWQGVLGWISAEPVADDEMKIRDALEQHLHSSLWLLPYLLLLLPTLALAAAGPVMSLLKLKLPPNVEKIWQFRPAVLGGLALITLLFLLAQWATGFGLQRAVDELVEEHHSASKKEQNTPEKMQRWEMRASAEKGQYHAKTTPWQRLALLLHLIGTIAVVGEAALLLRGRKAPPRVGVMW